MTKSPDEINKDNAKFWAKEKLRRDEQLKRLGELTGDARTHELAKFCEELGNLGSITAASFRLKQRARASGPRRKKELTAAIDTLLADNPNITAKEAWRKVENLPEAKGKTESAFASLLSRRKKDFQ